MSEERIRILKMIAEGKISPEEADELLDSLDQPAPETRKEDRPRFVKIRVEEKGEEKVNISLPLMLVKSFMNFIPSEARNKMEDKNIDIETILAGLEENGGTGTLVDVEDDDEHVEIRIE